MRNTIAGFAPFGGGLGNSPIRDFYPPDLFDIFISNRMPVPGTHTAPAITPHIRSTCCRCGRLREIKLSEHELCLTRIAYLDIDRGRIKKATMTIAEIITISPNVQSGEPVFTETRVPVRNLFDYLKAGDTTEEFLRDFPSVKKEQVVELLNFFENIFNIRTKEHENNFA